MTSIDNSINNGPLSPVVFFHKMLVSRRGGLSLLEIKMEMYKCRECSSEYHRIWWKNNPDKIAKYRIKQRKRIEEDRPKERERNKRDYQKHKQKRLKKCKEYRNLNKQIKQAHGMIKYQIKIGKIKRPEKCSICNKSENIHAHHADYSKPLEIIWLCASCHNFLHRRIA